MSAMPPADRVVMTTIGAVIVASVTGAWVEDEIVRRHYPDVSTAEGPLVWATWRRPGHDELVATWPPPSPPTAEERARGWWAPTIDELRDERRKARSIERATATRQKAPTGTG